jgi:pimeloyl-ACP methyl ester carboxylesterase
MSEAMLMPGLEERRAEIGGCEMRYFVAGAGPSLILLHGLGGSATNWTAMAPQLARCRRLLVPDLPGHGRSASAKAPDGLGSIADQVGALAAHERILPAAIVGHSLGCEVAVQLAVRSSDCVSALVLIAASGIAATKRSAAAFLGVTTRVRPARVAARFRSSVARHPTLRCLAFGGWGAWDARDLSPTVTLGFLDGPAHARDTATAGLGLLRNDARFDLGRVQCPSLVVWGARDRLTPVAGGFEYARRLRAPIRVLAATGHLVIGERPSECVALVEGFLDRVREVDELPFDVELRGKPRSERLNT